MQKEKIGWGVWISGNRKAQEQKAISDFKAKLETQLKDKLTEQKDVLDLELNQLTEDLGKQEILMKAEDFDKMPQGYLRFCFKVRMPSLRFFFINEFE